MSKRKLLAVVMALVLSVSMFACTSETPTENSETATSQDSSTEEPQNQSSGTFQPGDYEATVPAMKGDLTVKVSLDADKITAVEVVKHEDTVVIADAAIARIPAQIVEKQSLAVDTVAGATVTSGAIISAAKKAVEQSGADMATLTQTEEKAPLESGAEETADIVIVGAGGAGLTAAVEALRDGGANVVVLEKLAYIGGSTRVAGGAIWMTDTKYNEEAGVSFTSDELVEFMEKRSDMELNRPLLKKVAEVSPTTINYLMENGMPLNTEKKETPSLGHPDSKLFLLSPENSSSGNGGAQVADFLAELATKNGADIRLDSEVTELVVEDGAVTGVKVKNLTSEYVIKAKKVVLATGGFTRNESMIEELAPEFTKNIPFTGAGSDGDGITMTKDLDTVIVGNGMMGLKTLNYNLGYYGPIGGLVNHPSVLVNKNGERFANEKMFYSEITYPLNTLEDKTAYGIVDGQSERIEDLDKAVELGLVFKSDTIEDLAQQAGVNAETLKTTIEEYNATKESGENDPKFGTPNEKMVTISQAPYYIVPIKPGFIGSIPGLKVNEQTQVLNSAGEPIENLYASGELIFGNMFSKWYPASGTGVGCAVYTGAISGQNAKAALSSAETTEAPQESQATSTQ